MRLRCATFGGLAILALLAAGCLLGSERVGSGPEAMTWRGNKLTKTYPVNYEKVWTAVAAAVTEAQLSIETQERDGTIGWIKAKRIDGTLVTLDLTNLGGKSTRVSIGVGFFGTDNAKQAAMALIDSLDKKLGK